MDQDEFDQTIGRLDRVLSLLVNWAKNVRDHGCSLGGPVDQANRQTMKHHAEDMIAAGKKILSCISGEEGT